MRAISIIKSEHRNLGAVLYSLEKLIEELDQGKQADFDLDGVVEQFRREAHRRTTLLQMFLEILLHAAYADGVMQAAEQRVLRRISEHLGFSLRQFQQLEAMVRAQRAFHAGGEGYQGARPQADLLAEAYDVLGVATTASDNEVKKAYRRLMNQHHPDKLVAKGMPEEMIKLATEKTQEIKAAYETIKKARGNK